MSTLALPVPGWRARLPVASGLRWRQMAWLLVLLPLFGQSFHYLKVVPPLWALSKAWPVLSLPLVLAMVPWPRPEGTRQIMASFTWLLLLPSFIAIATFQQNFFLGLLAQTKLLPLLYFFSFYALLLVLRPTPRELETGFLVLAAITFILIYGFGALAPQSAYIDAYKPGDSPFLSVDGRGNRIRMPMFFGMIGLLYCYRRFLARPRVKWLALVAAGFAAVLWLVKSRSFVLGIVGMLVLNGLRLGSARLRLSALALAPLGLVALLSSSYVATAFSTDTSSGFDTRWISTLKALGMLGTDPWRWAFGVGTISPIDPAGMMTWFNHFFFLADITWLGIIFEYGVIGALLIAAIAVRALLLARKAQACAGGNDAFLGALEDYILYALMISELNPLTLAPGELAVVAALAAWRISRARGLAPGVAA